MIVLIATDLADGDQWIERQPYMPSQVRVLTPRSPHRARGYTASGLAMTDRAARLKTDVLTRLLQEAMPCLAASIHQEPAMTEKLTAEQWCDRLGIRVVDPDGWRKQDAPAWSDPIDRGEFDKRAADSTIAPAAYPNDREEQQ